MKKYLLSLLFILGIIATGCIPQPAPPQGANPSIVCLENQDVWIEIDGNHVNAYMPTTEFTGDFYVAWNANSSWTPIDPDNTDDFNAVASNPIYKAHLEHTYAPGSYRFTAWFVRGQSGADIAKCIVTITGTGAVNNVPHGSI